MVFSLNVLFLCIKSVSLSTMMNKAIIRCVFKAKDRKYRDVARDSEEPGACFRKRVLKKLKPNLRVARVLLDKVRLFCFRTHVQSWFFELWVRVMLVHGDTKALSIERRYCDSTWQQVGKKNLIVTLLPVGDGTFHYWPGPRVIINWKDI